MRNINRRNRLRTASQMLIQRGAKPEQAKWQARPLVRKSLRVLPERARDLGMKEALIAADNREYYQKIQTFLADQNPPLRITLAQAFDLSAFSDEIIDRDRIGRSASLKVDSPLEAYLLDYHRIHVKVCGQRPATDAEYVRIQEEVATERGKKERTIFSEGDYQIRQQGIERTDLIFNEMSRIHRIFDENTWKDPKIKEESLRIALLDRLSLLSNLRAQIRKLVRETVEMKPDDLEDLQDRFPNFDSLTPQQQQYRWEMMRRFYIGIICATAVADEASFQATLRTEPLEKRYFRRVYRLTTEDKWISALGRMAIQWERKERLQED